ncbi:hypothetical protein [Vulcanococcus sp.]|uniref:hypothetical protein n=1 Tax=Vulcanococcus sp. TaxID=2856995 RepID=UPI0037D9CB14
MASLIFGASSPVGQSLYDRLVSTDDIVYVSSRRRPEFIEEELFLQVDLHSENFSAYLNSLKHMLAGQRLRIFFCSHIWLTLGALDALIKDEELSHNIASVIVLSSASYQTKTYSISREERRYASKLRDSHRSISTLLTKSKIPHFIVAPTVILGQSASYSDKLSRAYSWLSLVAWILVMPTDRGLRQPIAPSQLADLLYSLASSEFILPTERGNLASVGGDEVVSIDRLLLARVPRKPIITIHVPSRLWLFASSLVAIIAPQFGAILHRMPIDLLPDYGLTSFRKQMGNAP